MLMSDLTKIDDILADLESMSDVTSVSNILFELKSFRTIVMSRIRTLVMHLSSQTHVFLFRRLLAALKTALLDLCNQRKNSNQTKHPLQAAQIPRLQINIHFPIFHHFPNFWCPNFCRNMCLRDFNATYFFFFRSWFLWGVLMVCFWLSISQSINLSLVIWILVSVVLLEIWTLFNR